jgi:UDP-N-acetylmuramoyl-tripeptide--D-alanyl-D-alanine ligase
VHRSVKSYNNHVGVPLSCAHAARDSRFGVFEMGMNHAGELAALTRQVRPHVAIVTAIAPAHIEYFGTEEAIADAKAEIFEGLEPGGTAIIPFDSPHRDRLMARQRRMPREHRHLRLEAAHADVRAARGRAAPGGGSLVTPTSGRPRLCYTVAAPGDHWVANSLAVMAAVRRWAAIWARPGWRWPRCRACRAGARGCEVRPMAARAADRRKLQRQPRLDEGDAGAIGRRRRAGASPCWAR